MSVARISLTTTFSGSPILLWCYQGKCHGLYSSGVDPIYKGTYQPYLQDLSLLTHLSQSDISHLQSVGKDAHAVRSKFILKDDQHVVWDHVQTLKGARIDFILDNGNVQTNLISKVLMGCG